MKKPCPAFIRFKTFPGRTKLTGGKIVYRAVPVNMRTFGIRKTAEDLVALGCAVDATTLEYVLAYFAAKLPELIARDGCRRRLGDFITVYPVISGGFPEPGAAFDPARNRLSLSVTALKGLREGLRGVVPVNVTRVSLRPAIIQESVYNRPDGSGARLNSVGTGRMCQLRIRDVAFVEGRADEGIWLEGRWLEEPVKMRIVRAGTSWIDFMTDAALPAGRTLTLKLCTRGGLGPDAALYTVTRRVVVRP